MKRILSLVLAVLLCVSLLPFGALADEEIAEAPAEEAVEEIAEAVEEEAPAEEPEPEREPDAEPGPEEEPDEAPVREPAAESEDESALDGDTIIASGTCGENLTWTLTDDGILTISGEGEMREFLDMSLVPWRNYRTTISSVIIINGVLSISEYAFYNCEKLTSVLIPSSITNIGKWAFSCCGNLTDITISVGLTSISDYAFWYCDKLESIEIPNGVVRIGSGAFFQCSSLKSVKLPNTLQEIGSSAFDSCDSLDYIDLPNGLTSIGTMAFDACHSLTSISIPDSVTSIGEYVFSNCYNLSEVKLPQKLTVISDAMFNNCYYGVLNVTIPESVTLIGKRAFAECNNMESISIPAKVSSIGNSAFYNCTDLKSIQFTGAVPEIAEDAFENVTATAYYPANDESWTEDVKQNYGGSITWVGCIYVDKASFPDERFRGYVSEYIDTDNNGLLTDKEISAVTEIDCSEWLPASLEGIAYFTNLEVLNCSGPMFEDVSGCLSGVDLSANPKLRELDLSFNPGLKALDVSMLPALESLSVGFTGLSELDLTHNAALTRLICDDCAFSALDLSGNPALAYLDCCGNAELTALDLRPCPALAADYLAGGRHLEWMQLISQETYDSIVVYGGDGDGGMEDHDYHLAVNTWTVVEAGGTALSITAHPQNVTAAAGGQVTLHVAASGDGLTYQWEYSKDGGAAWIPCRTGGYNTDTFAFSMKATLDGRLYRCKVSDGTTTLKSSAATITLSAAQTLKITKQPKSAFGAANKQVTFTVKATGDGLTYQWQYLKPGETEWKNCTAVGYNTDTFSFKIKASLSGRQYRCVVTDAGENSVTSDAATVALFAITSQPTDVTAAANAAFSVTVGAAGDGLEYQWYYKNAGAAEFSAVTSVSGPTYSTTMRAKWEGRQQYCVVTDRYGNTLTSDTVTFHVG